MVKTTDFYIVNLIKYKVEWVSLLKQEVEFSLKDRTR